MADFKWKLGFDIDQLSIEKIESEMKRLRQEMAKGKAKFEIDDTDFSIIEKRIDSFESAFKKAFNPDLNKLNLKKFINELKEAGLSLQTMKRTFAQVGIDGNRTFAQIENQMRYTGIALKENNKLLDEMAMTFKNTLKWNMASGVIHNIEGSIQKAIGFTEKLDESLNNIRVVTGGSAEDMAVFAERANEAAKALGKTTVEYTDASLLFFQQGKSKSEVEDLTKATLIGSNITGQAVSDTAELLTAALNGFNLQADKAMEIMDKFAAVGATTGSDFAELATGFSKVASMAHTAGVNVNQLNGMLATVSTVTREAPESIGTSFKTIFGRMAEIKAGKKDEDGWELGKVDAALKKVGLSVLDANGKMKEMGQLMEEVGDRWKNFNKETKMGLSTAMAGNRQQNRLIALFNNWEMYRDALQESMKSEGEAERQNLIRMDSITYKAKQLKAELEELWSRVIDSDTIKFVVDSLTSMVAGINDFADSIGGIGPMLVRLGAILTVVFSKQIYNGATTAFNNLNKNVNEFLRRYPELKELSKEDQEIKKRELQIGRMLGQERQKEFVELQNIVKELEKKVEFEEEELKRKQANYKVTLKGREEEKKAILDIQQQYLLAHDAIDKQKANFKGMTAEDLNNSLKRQGVNDQARSAITKGFTGNVEFTKYQERINTLLEDTARKFDSAEKRAKGVKDAMNRLSDESSEYAKNVTVLNDKLGRATLTMSDMTKEAQKSERQLRYLQLTAASVGAFFALKDMAESLNDEFLSLGDKISRVGNSIGMSLMMIPHPAAMATGAIITVGSTIADLVVSNYGLAGVIKDNKKLADNTNKTIIEAKNNMKELREVEADFYKLRALMKDGKVNRADLGTEEMKTYQELATKISELAPDLVAYYDAQGNAIIDLSKNLKELNEEQQKQIRLANSAKTSNAENFAKQYNSTIAESTKKISDGEIALKDPDLDPEKAAKIKADIQKQQAALKEANAGIRDNIVNPIYDGNEAYSKMSEKQQEIIRGLFTVQDATNMAYSPARLGTYAQEMQKVLVAIGDSKELSEKVVGMEKEKRANLIENLSLLKLEGEEYNRSLAKMTEYYSTVNTIKRGPMNQGELERVAGVKETDTEADFRASAEGSNSSIWRNAGKVDEIGQQIDDTMYKMDQMAKGQMDPSQYEELRQKLSELTAEENKYKEAQWASNMAVRDTNLERMEEMQINEDLAEKYWDQLEALAQTTEGYNQIAEAYNSNLEVLENMKAALGENSASQEFSKEQMDGMAESLEAYRDKIPGLSDALDEFYENGVESFDGLRQFMGEASEGMAEQNGRMYAVMNMDNESYYNDFLSRNQEATRQMFIEYGIRAEEYRTLGEYEKALDEAKEKGKLNFLQRAINEKILMEQEGANQNAAIMNQDVNNAGNATETKVGFLDIMANAGLSTSEKLSLGFWTFFDYVTKGASGMANAVIGALNSALAGLEDMLNSSASKINGVLEGIPGVDFRVGTVSLGRVDYFSGTNKAADYAASLANKKSKGTFNYSGSNPAKKVSSKPGVSPGNIGGGGGLDGNDGPGASSGSKDSGRTQEDMEFEKDALHDTNVLLQQQDNLLKQLKDDEEDLYGKARMDNLTQQNQALAEKKKILQDQLTIIKQHGAELKNQLASKGVTFAADGTVTNYNQLLEQKVNAANAISDPDAKKEAQDAVKELMNDLKDYEDFVLKTRFDKEQAIKEVEKLQREIYMEQFEYKIKVQLELAEDQQEYLDFLKEMNTEFQDLSENYDRTVSQLNTKLGEVAAIQEHIKNIMADQSLSEKERIEQADKYEKQLQQATVSAKKLRQELVKMNEQAIKEGVDLLDRQLNKFENLGKELNHIENMMKLIGQGKNYEQLDKVYEAQGKNLQAQLDTAMSGRDAMKDYISKLEEGSEEWEYANEQLAKMDEQVNKLTEQTLEAFQEEFRNSINGIMDALDKELSGGMGLDKLKEQWADLKKEQEKYLSVEERIVEVGKLRKKVQTQINEATNPETVKLLEDFMNNELKHLTIKEDLTESDMERAEKLYEITQRQIALEEARNNRTIQRLVRDASGNWSYQYVEDTKIVADAQLALSDKLAELMAFDEQAMKNNQDEIIALKEKHVRRLQEITAAGLEGEYATEEEFNAALEAAEAEFNAERERLGMAHIDLMQNYSESSLAAVLDAYKNSTEDLGVFTDAQEGLLTELANTVGTSWTSIQDAVILANVGSAESFRDRFKVPVEGDADEMFGTLTGIFGNLEVEWGNNVVNMRGSWRDALYNMQENMETRASELEARMRTSTTQMKTGFETDVNAMGSSFVGVRDKVSADAGHMRDSVTTSSSQMKTGFMTDTSAMDTAAGQMKDGVVTKSGQMKDAVVQDSSKMKGSFTTDVDAMKEGFRTNADLMGQGFSTMKSGVISDMTAMKTGVDNDSITMKSSLVTNSGLMKTEWTSNTDFMREGWNAASTRIKETSGEIKDDWKIKAGSMKDDWGTYVDTMKTEWATKSGNIKTQWGTDSGLMKADSAGFKTDWATQTEAMKTDLATKGGDMKTSWKANVDLLKGDWSTAVSGNGGIIGLSRGMTTEITGEFGKVKSSWSDDVTSKLGGDWDTMTDGPDGIKSKSKGLYDAINGDFTKVKDNWAGYVVGMKGSWKAEATTGNDSMTGISGTLKTGMNADFEAIRDKWASSVENSSGTGLKDKTSGWKSSTSTAVDAIKSKYGEYKDKVETVTTATGTNLEGLKTKTSETATKTDELKDSSVVLTDKIKKEWEETATLIGKYQSLDGEYDNLIEASENFCTQLAEQIRLQKEAATGVTTPGTTPTPSNPAPAPSNPAPAPTPPPSSGGGGTGGNGTPDVGDVVTYTGGAYYSSSYGDGPTGNRGPGKSVTITQVKQGRAYPIHVESNDSAYGWLRADQLSGFDTGGYTGEWGNKEGKVAMLHEKEIVLNKDDTRNILDAVQIVRDYAAMIRRAMGGNVGAAIAGVSSEIQQSVTINADFSGVKSSLEIEKAFENIANRASQFARRK